MKKIFTFTYYFLPKMFCPKCGNADQKENSFCRKCGTFLLDFEKLKSKETTPEQHFLANNVLNVMTAVVSLGLAITLYVMFLGKGDTPIIIYLTAGFLTAMFFWQVQVFWRNLLLKKQFPKRRTEEKVAVQSIDSPFTTEKLLPESDFSNIVPTSITENSTKTLKEKTVK